MKVCMIGTGYVGLVSGTCFAEIGHQVTCVDLDEVKVAKLRKGVIPIYEPGLDDLVVKNVEARRLSFTTDIANALDTGATMFFIAVGTPTNPVDGSADLSYVYKAVEGIAQSVAARPGYDSPIVLVTKSTVPVGTNRTIQEIVGRHLPASRFAVASNPEFLREGAAIDDFMNPDRIVVGSSCEKARILLEDLYRPLTRNGVKMQVVSEVETAEMIKYAANAFLATKITFMNEVARLSERVGANVGDIVMGVGLDRRIGRDFLNPGPGYGGSCFPKDTSALAKTALDFGSPLSVVEAVIAANDHHKAQMIEKIASAVGGDLRGKRIAVLGLAFKADTDDMRDSPALVIVPGLQDRGATVVAYDPVAADNARRLMPDVSILEDVGQVVDNADALVILTEWAEFTRMDLSTLMNRAAARVVVDLRNVVSRQVVDAFDGDYHPIGRAPKLAAPAPVLAQVA